MEEDEEKNIQRLLIQSSQQIWTTHNAAMYKWFHTNDELEWFEYHRCFDC